MKSRNILILALIMALVTTLLFNNYLKDLDKKYKQNENKISVLVAKETIGKNQTVTNEMVELKELDKDAIHEDAVKSFENIQGKYALTDIKSGEVLMGFRFTNQFEEDKLVTRKVREGYRAVSLEVNYVESVSNLIEPEDYVDVAFSETLKGNGVDKDVRSQLILEGIRVLAVGERLIDKESISKEEKQEEQSEEKIEYTAVTLELKPEDALKLINNDEKGNIKLILRSKVFP